MNLPDWSTFREYLEVERHIKYPDKSRSWYYRIKEYFRDKEFTRLEIRGYFSYIKALGYTNNLMNKHLTTLRNIAHYLESPVMQSFKKFPENDPEKEKYIFTNKQLKDIINYPMSNIRAKLRYKALFALYAYTGMRPSDADTLTRSGYDGANLYIRNGKTGSRIIPVVPQLKTALDTYITHIDPHGKLFDLSSTHQRLELKRRLKALNIPDCSLYSFRYSFINGLLDNGAEIEPVADIAGHTIETLRTHYRKKNIKKMKDTIEATHPLLKAKNRNIDSIKRIILERCRDLIDESKFDISLELIPKSTNTRKLYIS